MKLEEIRKLCDEALDAEYRRVEECSSSSDKHEDIVLPCLAVRNICSSLETVVGQCRKLLAYIQVIEDAIELCPDDFMLRADLMQRFKEVRQDIGLTALESE